MRLIALLTSSTLLLSGCTTPYRIPSYAGLQSNSAAISALGAYDIGLGIFEDTPFDPGCRGLHKVALPDGLTPAEYVRNAFAAELRSANAQASGQPKTILSGKLETVRFSSSTAITMGQWELGIALRSSNGKLLRVTEHFEFDSGFHYVEACNNVSKAFPQAVQRLIGKTVSSPEFRGLLTQGQQ